MTTARLLLDLRPAKGSLLKGGILARYSLSKSVSSFAKSLLQGLQLFRLARFLQGSPKLSERTPLLLACGLVRERRNGLPGLVQVFLVDNGFELGKAGRQGLGLRRFVSLLQRFFQNLQHANLGFGGRLVGQEGFGLPGLLQSDLLEPVFG